MDITDIPQHNTLLSKIESIKCIIQYFIVTFTRHMKEVLKDELDARDIGRPSFVQKNLILSKLDELVTDNKPEHW